MTIDLHERINAMQTQIDDLQYQLSATRRDALHFQAVAQQLQLQLDTRTSAPPPTVDLPALEVAALRKALEAAKTELAAIQVERNQLHALAERNQLHALVQAEQQRTDVERRRAARLAVENAQAQRTIAGLQERCALLYRQLNTRRHNND
jgi:hypothetical protein